MNIREALLKAADYIEAHPTEFDFGKTDRPHPCETPGCALGWIGFFMGVEAHANDDTYFLNRVADACNVPALKRGGFTGSEGEFYFRMNELGMWIHEASECAEVMRLYADKYHPAEKPKHIGIPASVRAIFETAQSCSA